MEPHSDTPGKNPRKKSPSRERSGSKTKKKRSPSKAIAAQWTPKLANAGWAAVPHAFYDNYHKLKPPITSLEAMFILQIMRHKWDEKPPWIGYKLIAKRMGLNAESSARRYGDSLRKKRYMEVEYRKNKPCLFYFGKLFEALEELMKPGNEEDPEAS